MDLKLTILGRWGALVLVTWIVLAQQCNISRLQKNLLSKPEPVIQHVTVYDTVWITPEIPDTTKYPEGQRFHYEWCYADDSNSYGTYITKLRYKKGDLIELPVGENDKPTIVRIKTKPEPIQN